MRANPGIVLVEVKNEVAILRSVTELQPTVSSRMSVPYRDLCAYTFGNGKLTLQVVMSVGVQIHMGLTSVCCYVMKMNNFTLYYSVCVI